MTQSQQRYFIFAGLGNPGQQYEMTRHNMGYLVVKALARKMGWHFQEEDRFSAFVVKKLVNTTTVHLLLPTTYMNLSGVAIKRYLDFFKLDTKYLVIVVDDIALPFGQIRLKTKGSAGGHNGLKSIETHLGTSEYMRLRMGIGHPGEKDLVNYVLDPFSQEELKYLLTFVDRGVEALLSLLKERISQVMNAVNTASPRPTGQSACPQGEEKT